MFEETLLENSLELKKKVSGSGCPTNLKQNNIKQIHANEKIVKVI